MAQKERIEELERRLQALEALHPKQHVQRHVSASQVTTRSTEETALQELTEEEAAWLKAREMPTDSRQQLAFSMRNADTSDTERRILAQLKKKRNVFVTWQA